MLRDKRQEARDYNRGMSKEEKAMRANTPPQTKPTAGAIRAAEALLARGSLSASAWISSRQEHDRYIAPIARIIDRETGLAEMREALKAAEHALRFHPTDSDYVGEAKSNEAWSLCEAAIAKAEKGK